MIRDQKKSKSKRNFEMKYISVEEMRNIDIQTDAVGDVSFAQLMDQWVGSLRS